ncbi:hypothetical protein BHE74_00015534 [Ensete ventricosum]|nr:hypothetical protein BHE74_00015534 [Ensete ventricosum]
MSPEHSMLVNPGEDAPPATQPTSGGAYRPPPPFPSFGDESIPSMPGDDTGTRTTLPLNELTPTTCSADDLLHFSLEFDHGPLGDATKQPEPAPSASAHNFPDPDTLSSDSISSLREQLRLVNQRLDDVRRTLRMKLEHAEGTLYGSPFVQKIQDTHIPSHFCLPMLEAYDSNSDSTEHVAAFYAQMTLYDTSDAIMCRAFPMTLRGIAQGWYNWLPPSSIHFFNQLAREFEGNFLSSARPKPTTASLLGMRKEEENLGQYLARFIDEIDDLLHRGHLDRYIKKPREPYLHPKGLMERQIDVIVGGPTAGESPYSLAFGTEAILPPEVIFPTLRIENFTPKVLETSLRENLDMLEERKAMAHLKNLHYQGVVTRLYNRRL